MQWYYADAGKQVGPVDESELDRLVGLGLVRRDTLVWHEGMPAWQTLGAVRGWPSAPASPGAPSPSAGRMPYAGFWVRFVARLIDGVLLGAFNAVLRIPLAIMLGVGAGAGVGRRGVGLIFLPAALGLIGISVVISIAVAVAYEVYFVSTRGGTLGKMALGLKIVRADGSPVPAGLALGRYFAQWLSGCILMIGYLMAAFDSEKRALHDRICETRVIHSR
jgi:uncharacterized RDD family membrane protein YckC